MSLYKKLEDDMKTALKGGDVLKLSVLRMLISAVKMYAINKSVDAPQDADIQLILQKQTKQRKESIVQFEKGNRPDLADKERAELKILESYMEKQLSDEEIVNIVKDAIVQTGAVSKSDMGTVMKAISDKVRGRADGRTVSQTVMGLLK